MYRELKQERVHETIQALRQRISERFPESGLSKVAGELCDTAKDAAKLSRRLGRPSLVLRTFAWTVTLALIAGLGGFAWYVATSNSDELQKFGLTDIIEGMEALINDVVFVGIAVWFLFSIEQRRKRARALRLIARIRSLAHVIDMHQLTKDPERLAHGYATTGSSPAFTMTRQQLGRYLDYCSELLSLLSKCAAMLANRFDDEPMLRGINDIEGLCTGLSRKIWQKIMILQQRTD